MHIARVDSHYGTPIFLDQCASCGGVWFDKDELFRIKQGESKKTEILDDEKLKANKQIVNSALLCPRDGAKLNVFRDPYFPKQIIIESCNECGGFWFDHGEPGQFQEHRAKFLTEQKGIDPQFEKEIKELMRLHESGGAYDTLGALGKFLSTPLDRATLEPLGAGVEANEAKNIAFNIVMAVIYVLLQILTKR